MPEEVTRIRIFIAAVGDSKEEVKRVREIIDEVRRDIANSKKLDLFYIDWDEFSGITNTNLDEFIDRKIGNYDILVCLVSTKISHGWRNIPKIIEKALKKYDAGEISHILLYLSGEDFSLSSIDIEDITNILEVKAFEKEINENNKGIINYYKDTDELARNLRRTLMQITLDWKLIFSLDTIRDEIREIVNFSTDNTLVRVIEFIENRLGTATSLYFIDETSPSQARLKYATAVIGHQIKTDWNITETPFSISKQMISESCFVIEVRSPEGLLEGYLVCEKRDHINQKQNHFSKTDYLYFVALGAELSGRYRSLGNNPISPE